MTLAVAWIANGVAYIVADSVRTIHGASGARPTKATTAFGESVYNAHDRLAYESDVKVVQIGDCHVASLAGNAQQGFAVLEDLHTRSGSGFPLEESLHVASRNLSSDVELLVAGRTENGSASVWHVREGRISECYADHEPVLIGSARSDGNFRTFVLKTIRAISSDPNCTEDSSRALAEVTVSLQAQGPRFSQMHRGVGGTMYGLRCNTNGVVGHDDTFYILMKRCPGVIDIKRAVLTGWRNGIAFVLPYFPDGTGSWTSSGIAAYGTTVNTASVDRFESAFKPFSEEIRPPRYVAWIDMDTSGVVLYEQTSYVVQELGSVVINHDGFELGVQDTKHARIINSLPSLAELHDGKRNAFWFIGNEDHLRHLVETDRVK